MNYKILKKTDYITTGWSGGDTTQFYIYPEDKSYQNRDFLFRLSSATVNLEKSVFTKLDGISRKLMLLSGEMELVHKEKYTKKLMPFEQDSFMGDWNTESYGTAKDFNLMTASGCSGELEHIKILPNSEYCLDIKLMNRNTVINVLYSYNNHVNLYIDGQKFILGKGESLVVNEHKQEGFTADVDKKGIINKIKIANTNECSADIVKSIIYV